jgi:hypothetical protein
VRCEVSHDSNNVGSATTTAGGTSPIRGATMGVLDTFPCMPHSLVRTVCVSTPCSVPFVCGMTVLMMSLKGVQQCIHTPLTKHWWYWIIDWSLSR